MENPKDILVMTSISKEFPGVRALKNVTLSVREGEIHALCGENGAGKSTLMKILSGVYGHGTFTGRILIDGQPAIFQNIRDSEKAGVAIIHQELSLIPEMSVGENIFMGREPSRFGVINWNLLYSEAKKLLDSIGLQVNPRAPVKSLGVGRQQLVEIAKALSQNPRILVLDEPTSALSGGEIRILLGLLKTLRSRGVSSILISHKLDEVLDVADRVTVLRDGETVRSLTKNEADQERIVAAMVGRELKDFFPREKRTLGEKVFEVSGLRVESLSRPGKFLLKDVGFHVRKGEILGIAGLMGAGRTELLMSLFGVSPGKVVQAPVIKLNGKTIRIRKPHEAIAHGLSLLPEDRKRQGLLLQETVAKNMTLASLERFSSWGVVNASREEAMSAEKVRQLRVKTPLLSTLVKNLSGGNQQKVVLAKCLMTGPRVLFLDEPTRGIDVGAKTEIYHLMNDLAAQGLAIVMVSSELPEILGMSDRILVMSEGRIAGEFDAADATAEKLMAAATAWDR